MFPNQSSNQQHAPASMGPPPGGGPHVGRAPSPGVGSIQGAMCPDCGVPTSGPGGTCPGCGMGYSGGSPGGPAAAAPPAMHGMMPHGPGPVPRKSADAPGMAPQGAPLAPGIRMPGRSNPSTIAKPGSHNKPRR